ncbi:MAG: hypothetical protein KDA46_02475 [Parvularculaceae bacterium]|nr:hypothetical protein [Parvularculaceae bacterium]
MIRIILPLAVIAVLLFAPMYNETVTGSEFGKRTDTLTGYDYVGTTIDCWRNQDFSITGKCEPQGDLKGKLIFGAVFISAVAAVLGVLGLLPVIGRLTSAVTTLAGVVVIGAIGYYVLTQMGGDSGPQAVQWGTYLTGGVGLLTTISGMAGMRGR